MDFNTFMSENQLKAASPDTVPTMLWVDTETTGLSRVGGDFPLELGVIATDKWGHVVENGIFHRYTFDMSWPTGAESIYDLWKNMND